MTEEEIKEKIIVLNRSMRRLELSLGYLKVKIGSYIDELEGLATTNKMLEKGNENKD